MMLRGGVCVQSGRAAVCPCMKPPRRDERSGGLIGHSACMLVTCARGAIDIARAGTSGSTH